MATILVVDDVAANREVLVTLLRHQGHVLVEAADGQQALAAVQAAHPDLVITDVLMPVMDGYELVKQLRLDPATSRIPVVFYTAHYGEREARALALSSGVAFVLTKPVEPEEALKVVTRVLAGESEARTPAGVSPLPTGFDREHLRLLTDKLSEKTADLRSANARLRALINIGLELASERDAGRLLDQVCVAARDLFGATYVTLGIVGRDNVTVQRLVTRGPGTADWIAAGGAVPGMLKTVIEERRTVRGDNPGGDPAALRLPSMHPPIRAFAAAPIASPAYVYGWICLVNNEGRAFDDDDEQLLLALCGQVGRIYENGYFAGVAQKRAEELEQERTALRETEARMAFALHRSRTGGWDLDLVTHAAHRTLEHDRIFGYDTLLPEWTYEMFLEHVLAEDRAEVDRLFQHAIATGTDWTFECRIRRTDGDLRWIWAAGGHQSDNDGQPRRMAGIVQDVTERKRAEDALRVAEERMRFALEAAGVGIWDMDYTAGVLSWSETLEAQYGLRPRSFARTFEAFIERVHPDDRASLLETVSAAMKTGADFTTAHRAVWPDGTVRWLSGAGRVLLGAHGEPVRGVGISQDVTARRSLEEQFQQAQKMEAVGRLAGGIAHDFNNLLTVILGFCELSVAGLEPADPRQGDLVEIQKAGERAAGLTRQLLAFSRKQIIEPTLLDLNAVVNDLLPMLRRLIGEDVRIGWTPARALPVVMADRGQVEQIVMNLAVNARDAMPKGGALTIETASVDLDEDYARTHQGVVPGAYVTLMVTDTGTGMTPEVQARLFEPFFTTKEPGKGTGLGLATVYGIVARSGGNVGVYSEIGRGTSFRVHFPKAGAETIVAAPPAPAARPRTQTQTVLVVEDEAGLRVLARRLLQRQGYTVLVAADADEARRVFEEHPGIDVILTDVVMPGASGPDLTRELIERRPALKVIYMSGYTEEAIVQHGVLQPGIAFVHKPFTSQTLGDKIREVLDR